MLLKNFLLVGLGGMMGSMLRYACYLVFRHASFPLATFIVNIAGCFIIGLLIGYSNKYYHNTGLQLLLATGLCGGFTTFSAFSADGLRLMQEGRTGMLAAYIGGSVLLGVLATFAAYKLVT